MSMGGMSMSVNKDRKLFMELPTPRILVGGLNLGEHDPNTPALVAVSYPSHYEAQAVAQYLLSIQNGVVPFESSPNVCAGDTAIKVNISPKPIPNKGYLCQIMAKTVPTHLTYCFYIASYVTEEEFDVFCSFYDIADHYIFTVAHQDNLLLEAINLIKYTVNRRGV
ncbi:MAG TPA: hypothetical protein GX529_01280 [Firmicutes bacterium]|nr:hypothetical protein [Candidatus Fermentithermobacillaceae bacterium]